jgi:hypothetical protein
MGGRIWVEGNGERGSMFVFELPAAEPAVAPPPPIAEPSEVHSFLSRTRRIPSR